MRRRKFLIGCAGILASGIVKGAPEDNPYSLVFLRRGKESGWVNVDSGAGYRAFQWLLRDSQTDQVGYPPVALGHVLSWMQTFFRLYGYDYPVDITSGMRLYATNAMIEGASRSSLHIPDRNGVFLAADIRVGGVPGEYLGKLASLAQQGGVGFYGDAGHTHVDVGKVRYWRGPPKLKIS